MTPKEAIKHASKVKYRMVEYSPVLVGYVLSPTDAEWLELAVGALEKQTPKKVNKFFKAPDGYLSNGDCPSCKERVDEGTMYCETCGQAIDWGGKR